MFPLMSTLLSVSQRDFFLEHWGTFLNLCVVNIRQKDPSLQHLAMSGICRVVWIYCVRIHGEGNLVTERKLRLIAESLFPPKTTFVFPKDEPSFVLAKSIQYMAQVCESASCVLFFKF